MPVEPKDASTVVLMRDRLPEGGLPEVLLVRRHSKANFAAGVYVFPGGMLEENDYGEAALSLSSDLRPQTARSLIGDLDPDEKCLGLFVAAIRETFEEVGVLLAKKNGGRGRGAVLEDEAYADARKQMYRGELDFIDWVSSQGLTLATDDLVYFAHWITPAIRPKRFDTRFFIAQIDRDVDACTDRREVFDGLWLTPAEAVEKHARGELDLMRPTAANLELLLPYSTTREAIAALRRRHVPTILPKIVTTPDGGRVVLHPGDEGYDTI